MAADGTVIKTNEQVQEVWHSTTLALAESCFAKDEEEAFQTAWGIYT